MAFLVYAVVNIVATAAPAVLGMCTNATSGGYRPSALSCPASMRSSSPWHSLARLSSSCVIALMSASSSSRDASNGIGLGMASLGGRLELGPLRRGRDAAPRDLDDPGRERLDRRGPLGVVHRDLPGPEELVDGRLHVELSLG